MIKAFYDLDHDIQSAYHGYSDSRKRARTRAIQILEKVGIKLPTAAEYDCPCDDCVYKVRDYWDKRDEIATLIASEYKWLSEGLAPLVEREC